MALYSPRYSQLLQGVSKQPPQRRSEGQHTEQINCISDIVRGLRRRPGFELMDDTVIASNEDIYGNMDYVTHLYERGDGEEAYIIIINGDGDWQTFNAYTGETIGTTALDPGPLAYITAGTKSMRDKIRFHTIADTTFIVNTEVEVEESTGTNGLGYNGVLFWCKRSMYGKDYSVKYRSTTLYTHSNPSTVTLSSPTTDTHKQLNLSTSALANSLAVGAGSATTVLGNLNNVVYVDLDGSTTYTDRTSWQIDDTGNNEDVVCIKDRVDSIEDLPPCAPDGYKIKVSGLGNSDLDDFWVEWQSDEGSLWETRQCTEGKWVECAAPYTKQGLNPTTMPHEIQRKYTGSVPYFICDYATWGDREAGDDDSNPMPSFVGSTINDVFTYQNRLWFLSGENAVASRSFDYYEFFSESVAQPADDDPIDSSSSDNQITELKYGIVFNRDLVLLSDTSQFVHDGERAVTPSSFSVLSNTRYPTVPAAPPLMMGSSLIFPSLGIGKVTVWEYKKDPVNGLPDAQEITSHVSDYVELPDSGHVDSVACHSTRGLYFLAVNGTLYVCQMFYKDNERVQLAWHKWTPAEMDDYYWWDSTEGPYISDVFVMQDRLIAIVHLYSPISGIGYYPKFMQIDLNLRDIDLDNPEIHLDMKHQHSNYALWDDYEYNGHFYNARVALDFYYDTDDDPTYHQEYWFDTAVTSNSSDTNIVPNGFLITKWAVDSANKLLYVQVPEGDENPQFYVTTGCQYTSSLTPTLPYIKDANGRPYSEQTLIDDMSVDMTDTAYFEAVVGNATGDGYTNTFTGYIAGDVRSELGEPNHITGSETIPIYNLRELASVTLQSNHHLGFGFDGITWHVNMASRGRRT
jgi:hypothetical protein